MVVTEGKGIKSEMEKVTEWYHGPYSPIYSCVNMNYNKHNQDQPRALAMHIVDLG